MLKTVEIKNFRNLTIPKLKIPPTCTILVGDNGQGKTNFLEGVYFLSCGRPLRGTKDEMINWSENEAYLAAETSKADIKAVLSRGKETRLFINGKQTNFLSLFGLLPTVLFHPEGISLVSGPPVQRRRWLDRLISTSDKHYLYNLINYSKCLQIRNQLLKERMLVPSHLEVWNKQLSIFGTAIWQKRQDMLETFNKILRKASRASLGKEIFLGYKNPIAKLKKGEAENRFLKALTNEQKRELQFQATIFGPHRDDFEIIAEEKLGTTILEKNLNLFGSRGEQRQATIALKWAERIFLKEIFGFYPTLLLDDIVSELDTKNQELILTNLVSGQVIITTTALNLLPPSLRKKGQIFQIKKGQLRSC